MLNKIWDKNPKLLKDFLGQEDIVENLKITLKSAQKRKDVPDHILLCGPSGLGKSTLAEILANECKFYCHKTTGTKLSDKKEIYQLVDIIRIVPNLIIFIDEIHRLGKKYAEILYSVMQDKSFYGEDLTNNYTIIGATTSEGKIVRPLRNRFKHIYSLDFYSKEEITLIVKSIIPNLSEEVSKEISIRSHGVPRIAKNLLTELLNTAIANGHNTPNENDLGQTLTRLKLDNLGLRKIERKILLHLLRSDRPIGETELCNIHELEKEDLHIIETSLMRLSLISKTSRGRIITPLGINHILKFEIENAN